jgi:hypothetical protein
MVRHDPRPVKITFGEMRSNGTIGILVYCAEVPIEHSEAPAGRQGQAALVSLNSDYT